LDTVVDVASTERVAHWEPLAVVVPDGVAVA